MNSEKTASTISQRTIHWYFGTAAFLVFAFGFICALAFHGAEKRLGEEHARAEKWEEKAVNVAHENTQLRAALTAAQQATEQLRGFQQKNLSDVMDRLKTKTLLVTSLPEQPQGAQASLLPMMQHAGLLGLLMEVVQASQKQTGRAAAPAQVWIIPTTIEPQFAGDASRAWVIHADLQTGRSVDTPHHPAPVTPVAK